jgi:hypothetical protein
MAAAELCSAVSMITSSSIYIVPTPTGSWISVICADFPHATIFRVSLL